MRLAIVKQIMALPLSVQRVWLAASQDTAHHPRLKKRLAPASKTVRRLSGMPGASALAACVAALATVDPSQVRADDVWIGQPGKSAMKYSDVDIQGEQAGQLVFQTRAGATVSKTLDQVLRVHIQDNEALDKAEQMLERRDYDRALPALEEVSKAATAKWLRAYAQARLVVCYGAKGRMADTVRAWIEVLKVWPTYGASLLPKKPARLDATAVREVMVLIDEAVQAGNLSESAIKSLGRLRASLSDGRPPTTAAGTRPERAASAPKDRPPEDSGTAPPSSKEPDEPGEDEQGDMPKLSVSAAVTKATDLAQEQKYDEALSIINQAIGSTPKNDRKIYLPRLLTLKASTYMAKAEAAETAERGDEARQDCLHAGLAAMHVVAFYQDSPAVVEAIFLAARCHEKIGRRDQAASLYRECTEYATGRGQSEWGRRAKEALGKLETKR